MKNIIFKISFIFFIGFITFPSIAKSLSNSFVLKVDEVQPLGLIDHKISFYTIQIDFESISILPLSGEITEDYIAPSMNISEDGTKITIDFTPCINGTYLITGTRGDLALEYAVELLK